MPRKSKLSRIRSVAGRAGAAARWDGVEREPTVQVRVYASDAAILKKRPGSIADAVRSLIRG